MFAQKTKMLILVEIPFISAFVWLVPYRHFLESFFLRFTEGQVKPSSPTNLECKVFL